MDLVFVLATLATLPFWLLLLVFPNRAATARLANTIWVFVALGAVYLVVLAMGEAASADNLLTLDGYKELQTSDAALVAGWLHYLALDLFAGAWIVRDARRLDISRPAVVVCLLLTFVVAPLGLASYLLIRFKRTGSTSLEPQPDLVASS